MMANLICLGMGVLIGMVLAIVGFVLLMEPRVNKKPPTKDEWKFM